MYKFTVRFSVIYLLLTLGLLFSVLIFNMPQLLNGNKIVLFTIFNAVMLVGVGIFFIVFKERIILYLENYRREKQI